MYVVHERDELNMTREVLIEQLEELELDINGSFTNFEHALELDLLINSFRRVIAYNSIPGKFRGGIYDIRL